MQIGLEHHIVSKLVATYKSTADLMQVELVFKLTLIKLLESKNVTMVTVGPEKKLSLGYELGQFEEVKIQKTKYLVNCFDVCSQAVLNAISASEEFGRGLVILATGRDSQHADARSLITHIHYRIGLENLNDQILLTENDGKHLALFNINLSQDDFQEIMWQIRKLSY
jgi:hypothetical protein